MDWMKMLEEIFRVCIIPLLGILTTYLVSYLKSLKINTNNQIADKYITMLKEIVAECVIATSQTYVDSLKSKEAFNHDAQKEAFQKTYDAVLAILGEEAQKIIAASVGDLNIYITCLIESAVRETKLTKPEVVGE